MKKFVLIDQSITGEGGHYLSYAKSVLDCAKKEGFSTILVTNRCFILNEELPHCLYRLFTYTSLENLSSYRHLAYTSEKMSVRHLWGGMMKPCIQRVARFVFGAHYKQVRAFFQKKKIDIITPEENYKARCFVRDITELFKKIQMNKDDIIFIPTLSYVELRGIETMLHEQRLNEFPEIHLLFRWNPFCGRRENYEEELRGLNHIQQCFVNCEDLFFLKKLHFYTDSQRLTEQYNLFSKCRFITLPIPHTHFQWNGAWKRNPIRTISYLGDARPEKGFQYLPKLIRDLKGEDVLFQVQANFNISGGEGGIAACRRALEREHRVILYKQPLNADQYKLAVYKTDIMLILYDSAQYYARSSGIFAEAMSAGIPALIPADTWMSGEVCKGRYALLRKLISTFSVRRTQLSSVQNSYPWFRHSKNTTELVFRIIADWSISGDSIRAEITIQTETKAIGRSIDFLERDGSRDCLLHISVPEKCDSLKISLSGTYGQTMPRLLCAEIIELAPEAPKIGEISLIFDNFNYCTQLLQFMIENYSILKKSTDSFSKEWYSVHNAGTLIKFITNSTGHNHTP